MLAMLVILCTAIIRSITLINDARIEIDTPVCDLSMKYVHINYIT